MKTSILLAGLIPGIGARTGPTAASGTRVRSERHLSSIVASISKSLNVPAR